MRFLNAADKQNMYRHIVKWRPTLGKDFRGQDCELPFPDLLDSSTNWTILERIFLMEKKTPISFTDAALLAQTKYLEADDAGRTGNDLGHAHWYTDNFLDWIASLGYHIELTGDEFELYAGGVPTA